MSLEFDPHKSWLKLRAKAEATSNPLHKTLLEEVANHMEAEITGQHAALMETLTAEPVYHFWRVGPENMVLEGHDAVAAFYLNMFDSHGEQFYVVTDNIMVDDNGVITEGKVRQIYERDALLAMGVTESQGQAIADHELWLSNTQLITVWPHDGNGKLVGEDIYFGEDSFATLTPYSVSDLPSYYVRSPAV